MVQIAHEGALGENEREKGGREASPSMADVGQCRSKQHSGSLASFLRRLKLANIVASRCEVTIKRHGETTDLRAGIE